MAATLHLLASVQGSRSSAYLPMTQVRKKEKGLTKGDFPLVQLPGHVLFGDLDMSLARKVVPIQKRQLGCASGMASACVNNCPGRSLIPRLQNGWALGRHCSQKRRKPRN